MLPAKPKCIFIVTALAKPLLKIGTMAMKVMLFSFVQLGCVQIFRPFRGVEILPKNVARKAEVHIYCHCLSQAPVEDRYYTQKGNVAPLPLTRLYTNFYAVWRIFTVPAGKG
jgi:hypothetical protein